MISYDTDLLADARLAAAFEHPVEILSSNILSSNEKKGALRAWASDAFAVEDKVWLRQLPTSERQVPLASIQAALKVLNEGDRLWPAHPAITFPAVEEPGMAVGF